MVVRPTYAMDNIVMRELWRRHSGVALRFGLVGLSNTLISYLTFRALMAVLDVALFAQLFGYIAGLVWSFTLNSRWTFEQKDFSHQQFWRFLTLQGALLILSSTAIGCTVDMAGFEPTLSWVVIMAGITMVNYVLTNGWVFTARPLAAGLKPRRILALGKANPRGGV